MLGVVVYAEERTNANYGEEFTVFRLDLYPLLSLMYILLWSYGSRSASWIPCVSSSCCHGVILIAHMVTPPIVL